MRLEFITRAHTDPYLFTRVQEIAQALTEATGHTIDIRVLGHNPPAFTVKVDGSHVDDWMDWAQTIMFLRGMLVGFAFDNDGSYDEGFAAAQAKVTDALNTALSQDRESDSAVST